MNSYQRYKASDKFKENDAKFEFFHPLNCRKIGRKIWFCELQKTHFPTPIKTSTSRRGCGGFLPKTGIRYFRSGDTCCRYVCMRKHQKQIGMGGGDDVFHDFKIRPEEWWLFFPDDKISLLASVAQCSPKLLGSF